MFRTHRYAVTGVLVTGLIAGQGVPAEAADRAVTPARTTFVADAPSAYAGSTVGRRETAAAHAAAAAAADVAAAEAEAGAAQAAKRIRRVRVLVTSLSGDPMLLLRVTVYCRLRTPRNCDPIDLELGVLARYSRAVKVKRHKFTGVVLVGSQRFRMRVFMRGHKVVDRKAMRTGSTWARAFIVVPGGALRII